jgi:hypothetical protein
MNDDFDAAVPQDFTPAPRPPRMAVEVTPALLDSIERGALAATPGPWDWDSSGVWTLYEGAMGGPVTRPLRPVDPADGIARVGDPYPRGFNSPSENMAHIARMYPETALALVRRIRELEGKSPTLLVDDAR